MEATLIINKGEGELIALIKTAYAVLSTWLVEGKGEGNHFTLLL